MIKSCLTLYTERGVLHFLKACWGNLIGGSAFSPAASSTSDVVLASCIVVLFEAASPVSNAND